MNISNRTFEALQNRSAAYSQSENSALTYTINYSAVLGADTISASTWTSASNGVTIASQSNTSTTATAKLSGDPGNYKIVNKITTAAGEIDERIISLTITANDASSGQDYQ